MGLFLDAAYRVLKKENKPLKIKNITKKALELGILPTKGRTPFQTMKSKISTDILIYKKKSIFKRTSPGTIALREWSNKEYFADRFKKSLFDEDILVFDKKYLKEFVIRNGLNYIELDKLFNLINKIGYSLKRRKAEKREDIIQLISVFIVRYKEEYLTYKRTKRLPESKLHGFYSIPFGGHISPKDIVPLFNTFDLNLQNTFIYRELLEELIIEEKYKPKTNYKCVLYDDSKPVSKIHLGIVYDVYLQNKDFNIGEKGFLMDPKFENLESINLRFNDFENWSQIIIKEELKKHELAGNKK